MRASTPPPRSSSPRKLDADGRLIPSHGHGWLRPAQKGEVRNPTGGASSQYQQVVRMCREAAPAVVAELIAIAMDPKNDERVRTVAGNAVIERAFGKPREFDPREHGEAKMKLDLGRLPLPMLHALREIIRLGAFGEPDQPPPEIDGSAAE